jgi:hypothetical protein
MGQKLQITDAGSQSTVSGNRLAAIEPIAGISLIPQVKRTVAVCQFAVSANSGKPIAATNKKTGFQRKMRRKNQLRI